MPPDETIDEVIERIERRSSAAVIGASMLGLGLLVTAVLVARSWVVSSLTVAFTLTSAVTTFDKRVTQARTRGVTFPRVGPFREIGPDTPGPGAWFGIAYWVHIGLLVGLFIASWKATILVYVGGLILASCGFLETLGGLLLARPVARPAMEAELESLYVASLAALGPESGIRVVVRRALAECRQQGRREGTADLGPGFADSLLRLADEGKQTACQVVSRARMEGATDDDILEWWNLYDIQRRMVLWSEEQFRSFAFSAGLDDGLSADEAMQRVRGTFPIYGDPTDTTETQGDDRPLPHELRGRVDAYREKWGASAIEERLTKHSTYNALVRAELARGEL